MWRVTLKDVDGVYESDPAAGATTRPRRFASLGHAQALEFAGPLIQPKAVHFLDRHQRSVEVAALACGYETHVGFATTTLSEVIAIPPTRVFLLGLGTVGGGVYRRLAAMSDQFLIVGALVRSGPRHRAQGIPEAILQTDTAQLHQIDCDVVVDALPGVEPSAQFAAAFVARGIDLVTANKALIAHAGAGMATLAANHGASLRYSAAVGGSAPMIEARDDWPTAGRLFP
jgi:homoserine dehydrogenase